MRSPRPEAASSVALAALLVFAAACNDSDDDSGATDPPAAPATDADAVPATDPTATDVAGGDPPATEEPAATTTSAPAIATTTTIGTVPDTGVPGIDSADDFCRSWSEFAGSFQALALAAAFNPGVEAARSEVAAAEAVTTAVAGLGEHLPAELEEERDALVTDLAGPMTRRAERAVAILTEAGVTDEQISALAVAWLDTLAVVGIDDPTIAVTPPPEVDAAAFGAAADTFAAELPPINQDPSLITAAEIPLTEAYLADNCPDQGTLGGNDVIDQV